MRAAPASSLSLLTLSLILAIGLAGNSNAAPAFNDDGQGLQELQSQQQFTFNAPSSSPYAAAAAGSMSVNAALGSLDSLSEILPQLEFASLLEHIHSLPERRTVSLSPREEDVFEISEGEKALLTYHGIKFVDTTGHASNDAAITSSSSSNGNAFPEKMKYGKKALQKRFYDHIDTGRMKAFLEKFSGFRTRYYRSSTGRESQLWLLAKVTELVEQNPHLNMTVREFKHSWGQNSIIARLPVAHNVESRGKVIIGAHQDSTNLLPFLGAPGADDDGSGTTTIVEVMRILVGQGYVPPSYDVEWHFYSAEEGGMLGSGEIAQSWAKEKGLSSHEAHSVRGMLQMDMTAYVKPGTQERIGIVNDFVSEGLTKYIKTLIEEYNTIPWVDSKCGYACSDHTAWTKVGVDSAFAIEATFEDSNTGNIHSGRDTINVDGFSFDHMAQFVRLATAFVLELSA